MYKVFIDNKPVVFASKLKKINKYADSVIVNVSEFDQVDIIATRAGLPAEITLYVYCDDAELAIRQVFSFYDFVEAAGGIVKRKKRYLFIERFGKWDLPKGKIEEGEDPGQAAVREVEEECGIPGVEIVDLIGVTFHTHNHYGTPTLKKNWWFAMQYDGPKKLVPQSEEYITKAAWLKKDELAIVGGNTYPSILEVLDCYLDFFD